MKAAVQAGAEGVRIQGVGVPQPGVDEVLVRVRACGLNRADVGMAAGHAHGSQGGPGTLLGMEWAGEVADFGAGVQGLNRGDRVMGSGRAAFAEYAVADKGRVMLLPSADMSFEQAATLPVALQTMHDALVTNGRLQPGDAVLIQGASSGVGLMGLQIAKLMGAGLVIGTSTTPARRERLKEFGAHLSLDSSDPTWPQLALDATGSKGVNLIVDQLSGAQATQNMRACAVLARIVNVGRLAGTRAEFDFDLHALKRIQYIGVTFRTRNVEEVREINRRMRADLGEAIAAGQLALPIDRTFPFEEASQALAHMAHNAHFGKVVLTLP
ncbi:MAG: zinc-binding dehydrogenase [Cytophagales bacterium]|nr:zinc-binding dehydrogenase [Rhizobacter sp.]